MKLNRMLSALSTGLDRLASGLVFLLLISMVIVISAGVFWRYGLNSALSWSEELGRLLLVWVSFLGATLATYRGSHIGISIVFDRFPRSGQIWLERIVDLLSLLFMGSLVIGGINILPFVNMRISPTLSIHMGLPYLIIPISAGIIMIHILARLSGKKTIQETKT